MVICGGCKKANTSQAKQCIHCYQELPRTSSNTSMSETTESNKSEKKSCVHCRALQVSGLIATVVLVTIANLLFSFVTIEWYLMIDVVRYAGIFAVIVISGLVTYAGIKEYCKDSDAFDHLLLALIAIIILGLTIMVGGILMQSTVLFYTEVLPLEGIVTIGNAEPIIDHHKQELLIESKNCDYIIHSLDSDYYGDNISYEYNGYKFNISSDMFKCDPWH